MARAKLRELLVGTWPGAIAQDIRARAELVWSSFARPWELGMRSNDHLASVLVSGICPTGRTFIDVGAHIGSIVAAVLRNDPTVRVIAFEAMEEKAQRLRRRFPNVEVHGVALAEKTGEAQFFVNTLKSGYSSLLKSASGDYHIREVTVKVRRLEDLIPAHDVSVIKIDVEGVELGVLRGSEKIIASCRPTVMFESAPHEHGGYTKREMWDWLTSRNYGIFPPDRLAHTADSMSVETFLDSHAYPRRTTNYFAVPHEQRAQVRESAKRILKLS